MGGLDIETLDLIGVVTGMHVIVLFSKIKI